MGEFLGPDQDDTETSANPEAITPSPQAPAKLEKQEIIRTPEEQERLRAAVFEIAMSKRGRDQDPAEAEQVSSILTEHSIKSAESLGLEIPAQYMEGVQHLLAVINSRENAGITMTDDTLRLIRENDDPRKLYAALTDMSRLFAERGQIEAPPEEELAEFIDLVNQIKTEAAGEGDPHARLEEFEKLMFDVNEIREGNLEMEDIPAENIEEMLTDQIGELIQSGDAADPNGVDSITTEGIIPQYYKGKKGKDVPWHKVPREIQTQIRVGMHAAVKNFSPEEVTIQDFGGEGKEDVGPIIVFVKKEK